MLKYVKIIYYFCILKFIKNRFLTIIYLLEEDLLHIGNDPLIGIPAFM